MTQKERTAYINKLQKKYPGTRRQRTQHSATEHSVQFFDKITGKLVADVAIPKEITHA